MKKIWLVTGIGLAVSTMAVWSVMSFACGDKSRAASVAAASADASGCGYSKGAASAVAASPDDAARAQGADKAGCALGAAAKTALAGKLGCGGGDAATAEAHGACVAHEAAAKSLACAHSAGLAFERAVGRLFAAGDEKKRKGREAGPAGAAAAAFDPVIAAACQRACAAAGPYDETELAAQPGATTGQLTRCPVSGVVFEVKARNPRFAHEGRDYLTCCQGCQRLLSKNPGRYIRS